MSTKLITFRHTVNSTLTDATSVKLSDPTAAYGLRRVSDSSIVVADGADLTHDSTGVYSYSVTGLAAGVEYEYWIEWVYGGATKRVDRTFTTPPASGMSLTTARAYVRQFARNAGSSAMYSDEMIDRAIQAVGEDFCRATRCLPRVSSVSLGSGDAAADVSGVTDFTPERLIAAYIDGESTPLELCDWAELNRRAVDEARTGTPTAMAWEDLTTAKVYPTPDGDYALNLRWWQPFTDWVPGVSSGTADALNLNIRPEHLKLILPYGPTAFLQHSEKEHAYASLTWQKYEQIRDRLRGAGSLGSKSFDKTRPDW